MRKFLISCLCLLLLGHVHGQSLKRPVAASYVGLGAYSIRFNDVFSFSSNQAALAQTSKPAFGVYGEKRFLLNESNLYSAMIAVPTAHGNFGFQADYFGYKNYNESQLGIAYARNVGSKLDIGIKFNYYSFRIPTYQNSSAINFELGAIAHLSEKFHAGVHLYNPVGGKLSKTANEKLSAAYSFGIGYEVSDIFFIGAEIVKQEDMPVNVNAGVQYFFEKQFFARAGVATENASPYAGAGLSWKNLRLDIAVSYHPQLGISPGLMLIVDLKQKVVED